MSTFTTHIDTKDIIIAVLTLGLFIWFFVNNMRHTLNKKSTFFLESIRLFIVILVLCTLFQPEIVKTEERSEKPQLKILYDTSGSMATEDVVNKSGKIISREQQIKDVLASNVHEKLKERFDVTVENFAGPDKKASSTDMYSSMSNTLENSEQLRAMVLISDGSWNEGDNPLDAAIQFRSGSVPVFTLSTGRDKFLPDLVLEKVDAPTFGSGQRENPHSI